MSSKPQSRLLTPGPVPLPPEVLKALAQPVFHHRTPRFEALLERVWQGLKTIFRTQQRVLVLTSTGSGAMEAAMMNTLSPQDEILVVVNGKFGERWAEMGARFGLNVHRLDVPWGEALDLAQLQTRLSTLPNLKAVFFQAVETSTATMNPVREIADLIRSNSEALVIVDAITAIGAMELKMDAWNLDVVVAGSQKAFMLPTGLSFIALSDRAWQAQKKSKLTKYYFDLAQELKANLKGQTFFSSANSHLVALDAVIQRFERLGLDRVRKRCELLAEATRQAGPVLGLEVFSKNPSPSVTALTVPTGCDGAKLRDHLEERYQVTLMGGQDGLRGKILRVGHLGYITDEDMTAGFEALAKSLEDFGFSGSGAGPAQDILKAHLSRGPHAD